MARSNQYTAAAARLCLASDAKVFYADSSLQNADARAESFKLLPLWIRVGCICALLFLINVATVVDVCSGSGKPNLLRDRERVNHN
jgi:hypothetical protein